MTTSRLTSVAVTLTALALATTSATCSAEVGPTAAAPQTSTGPNVAAAGLAVSRRQPSPTEHYTYRWPVKPFSRQHPVRGFFGDPRISNHHRSHQFHFGIDISAPNGTPVYATISGRVYIHPLHPTTIAVVGASG